MHLYYAKTIADCLVRELEPYCHIIYIAGSIRRKKEEVKDIELVCVPKTAIKEEKNLFNETIGKIIIIHPEFERIIRGCGIIIKGKFTGRYMAIEMKKEFEGQQHTIMLDLFMPQPHDYWRQFAIRTGSAEYAQRYIAKNWNRKGWCGVNGDLRLIKECDKLSDGRWQLRSNVTNPATPPVWLNENDFFKWLNVQYLLPEQRSL